MFVYTSAAEIRRLAVASGGCLRVADGRSAYLPLDKGVAQPGAILGEVKSLLQRQ